jgi:hypothetical protein
VFGNEDVPWRLEREMRERDVIDGNMRDDRWASTGFKWRRDGDAGPSSFLDLPFAISPTKPVFHLIHNKRRTSFLVIFLVISQTGEALVQFLQLP